MICYVIIRNFKKGAFKEFERFSSDFIRNFKYIYPMTSCGILKMFPK